MIERYSRDFDGYLDRDKDGDVCLYEDHVAEIKKYKHALALLYYIIDTDMPQVFNEDSGGNGQLAIEIEGLLK